MKCIIAVATVLLLAVGSSQADQYGKGYGKPAAHYGGGHHGGHHVPCGSNLLLSCHPNVAHVPCVPAHGHKEEYHHAPAPAYHHAPAPAYHAPAQHHAPAPAYHAPAPAHKY
uniref:VM domain-containing protein n=1 Tax=Anopheles dirus TaxID=7168 RepID=A0A182NAJ7_9DIPT